MRVFLFAIFLFFSSFPAAYPRYIAEVTRNKVNVRIDSTPLSLAIGSLEEGERVRVVEEQFEWCRILLPKRFSCYISSDFIKELSGNTVEVCVSRLNVRTEPSLQAAIVGKVDKGTKFTTLEKAGGWEKVSCFPHAYGWVHKNLLKKLRDDDSIFAEGVIVPLKKENCKANYALKGIKKEYLLKINYGKAEKFVNKKVKLTGVHMSNGCDFLLTRKLALIR